MPTFEELLKIIELDDVAERKINSKKNDAFDLKEALDYTSIAQNANHKESKEEIHEEPKKKKKTEENKSAEKELDDFLKEQTSTNSSFLDKNNNDDEDDDLMRMEF